MPTVDEAKALVAQHRKAREEFAKAQDNGRKRDALLAAQAKRREGVAAEHARLLQNQRQERTTLAAEQLSERQALRVGYLAEALRIKAEREASKPTGLAAFFGRVTGITLIREKVQHYRHRQRLEAFVARKTELVQAQRGAAHSQRERHRMQAVDGKRKLKALAAIEKRELQSLEVKRVRAQRIKDRAGHEHMPALTLELKPKGRGASVRKAQNRYKDSLRVPEERQPRVEKKQSRAGPSTCSRRCRMRSRRSRRYRRLLTYARRSRTLPMTARAGTATAAAMTARLPRSRSREHRGVVSAGVGVAGMMMVGGRGSYFFFSAASSAFGAGNQGSTCSLDLVAKTEVAEIRIIDGDVFSQHNAFRAPGAPSLEELEGKPQKVGRFSALYSNMHKGIVVHDVFFDETNAALLDGLDFVFVCVDRGPVKRVIVDRLIANGTPFIEVGMGVVVTEGQLGGIVRVTTSTPETREAAAPHISYADEDGAANEYATNIQIADLNALNAVMAVIEWKRLAGIYRGARKAVYSGYSLGSGEIVNEGME